MRRRAPARRELCRSERLVVLDREPQRQEIQRVRTSFVTREVLADVPEVLTYRCRDCGGSGRTELGLRGRRGGRD